jgi:hypothetical protein
MTAEDYLSNLFVEPLTHELNLILRLKQVTQNTDLLGSYTEALVRRLSRRVVHPFLHVSTGSVIDYPLADSLRQIDLILWAPHPAPSIFEIDDFGLVPRHSTFGVIEIKRSNYSNVDHLLEEFITRGPDLVFPYQERNAQGHAMGIISVLDEKPSKLLQSLIKGKKVAAFFEKDSDRVSVRGDDVLNFINFLGRIKRSYLRTATLGYPSQFNTNS